MKSEPVVYEIRVEDQLSEEWTDWFDGLSICNERDLSVLTGPFVDQAALFGALAKIQSLNLSLVSVNRLYRQTSL